MSIAITFTCPADPKLAERRLKAAVALALTGGRRSHFTPEWVEAVDVREGTENCGYGPLTVSGSVQHWGGSETATYQIVNCGSRWKTYGAPSGTKYEIAVKLEQVAK